MARYITWNGTSSLDLDIGIEAFPNLDRPARKFESADVPGRNGTLYFFQDAWENYDQEYSIYAGTAKKDAAPAAWDDVLAWLVPADGSSTLTDYINLTYGGYKQLIDSYDPDTIRLAVYAGATEIENVMNRFARADIVFNCRPERFYADAFDPLYVYAVDLTLLSVITENDDEGYILTDGTNYVQAASSTSEPSVSQIYWVKYGNKYYYASLWLYTDLDELCSSVYGSSLVSSTVLATNSIDNENLTNPSDKTAKPMIRLTGSGSATVTIVGDETYTIEISSVPTNLYIDSETQNCYKADGSIYNSVVTMSNGFPVLSAGTNKITVTNADAYIYPRWWRL